MGRCLIFGAGERIPAERIVTPEPGDCVIAADGGFSWLASLRAEDSGYVPRIFVGDFDSSGESEVSLRAECEAMGTQITALPVEKDDTDTGAAVRIGRENGFTVFYLYGGTGGRIDHTMANIQLLTNIARNGGTGYLVGPAFTVTAFHASGEEVSLRIRGELGRTFSVFSAGGVVSGVTIAGAKYEITGAELTDDFALGVSNSFAAEDTVISCKKGTLLVMGEFLPDDCG